MATDTRATVQQDGAALQALAERLVCIPPSHRTAAEATALKGALVALPIGEGR